jgi:hypothetical protein
MKTGKHYFGLLTDDEQRNFKQACEEQGVNFDDAMTRGYNDLYGFIRINLTWGSTKQGFEYWDKIAGSNHTEQPIEKPKKTNISYFEDEKPLTTFRLIFVYSIITFVALSLFMIAYKAGYDNGRLKGFNQGVDFGTIEIQNLMGWDAPAAETVEQYEQMIKEQRDESTK